MGSRWIFLAQALIVLFAGVQALPAPLLEARQSTSTLSTAQVAAFKPFTFYASTAACNPSTTLTWTCGANCNANPTFQPVASGGDGDRTQFWFVGYDPTLKTVIVSHQGTDTSKIMPILTDVNIIQNPLNATLFPGISSSVEVHSGFAGTQSRSAPDVLAAVQTALSRHSANHVTLTGHSLGAAIALLDAVFLPLHLPSTVTFKTVTYGMPRVGNQAFADYVDAHVTLSHVNNKKDPVPILPGRFLGFHHPSGEVHITDANGWVACAGQDNTSDLCTIGAVPNIFEGEDSDHSGPYDGVRMGC